MSILSTVTTALRPGITEERLGLVVGEAKSVIVTVLGAGGQPLSLDGLVDAASTLNAADGSAITTPAVAVVDSDYGQLSVRITTTATATARTNARLTIALNFGATRDEVCQPIPVEIVAR